MPILQTHKPIGSAILLLLKRHGPNIEFTDSV